MSQTTRSQIPACLLSMGICDGPGTYTPEEFNKLLDASEKHAIEQLNKDSDEKSEVTMQRKKDVRALKEWMKKLQIDEGIVKRHHTFEDVNTLQKFFEKHDWVPHSRFRMLHWRKICPDMIMQSVNECLSRWKGDKDRIKHVMGHSTTGWDVSGMARHIMFNLELPVECRSFPINYVGDHVGISMLYLAQTVAIYNPDDLVLCATSEDQTQLFKGFHNNYSLKKPIWRNAATFGSGASCVLVGVPQASDLASPMFPIWALHEFGSYTVPNTGHECEIVVSEETGVYMQQTISDKFPEIASKTLDKLGSWLQKVLPGVPLDKIEYSVNLGPSSYAKLFADKLAALKASNPMQLVKYSIKDLQNFGCLGSNGSYHMLDEMRQKTDQDNIFLVASGPGITFEYGSLKRYKGGARRRGDTGSDGSNTINTILIILVAILAVLFATNTNVKSFLG